MDAGAGADGVDAANPGRAALNDAVCAVAPWPGRAAFRTVPLWSSGDAGPCTISAGPGGQEFALALAGRGGALAFGVLAQSLLAYLLLPEGRGVYALCVTSAMTLGALFTLSVGRAPNTL